MRFNPLHFRMEITIHFRCETLAIHISIFMSICKILFRVNYGSAKVRQNGLPVDEHFSACSNANALVIPFARNNNEKQKWPENQFSNRSNFGYLCVCFPTKFSVFSVFFCKKKIHTFHFGFLFMVHLFRGTTIISPQPREAKKEEQFHSVGAISKWIDFTV